jgi:hypothetical protein
MNATRQIAFQMPITNWKTHKFVGNLNITYDLHSGTIEYVTWGNDKIKTELTDFIKAAVPDLWIEICDAAIANREIELEPTEDIQDEE